MLSPLLAQDPAAPRLTVYDEVQGTRMDFSGQTLDNWANKVANMLVEEFDFEAGSTALIDLPAGWQSAVIALGVYNVSSIPLFDAPSAPPAPTTVFTTESDAPSWLARGTADVIVVTDDPFGRGVAECGRELPLGAFDFGPTVRFYGDQYIGDHADLTQFADADVGAQRYWVEPWTTTEEFERGVLAPLAAGGSAVMAAGLLSADRLQHIARAEKVTHFLTQS